MALDRATAALMEQMAAGGGKPLNEGTPEEARALGGALSALNGPAPLMSRVENIDLDVAGGKIPLRILVPQQTVRGVVVYYHGGGWVIGDLDTHDAVCREIAARAGVVVAAVDYRLAPEHPFPAAVEDAVDATAWVAGDATDLGIDPARLAVAGDSAGACLATAVAIHARDHGGPALRLQLLAYPKIDFVNDHPSHHLDFGPAGISLGMARLFDNSYLPDPARRTDPLASPLATAELTGLPPALIVAAERDTLRDEAELYGRRLHKAGVTVATMRAVGLLHGFLNMTGIQPAGRLFARSAYAAAGLALKEDAP
jgi:acetyl esterase